MKFLHEPGPPRPAVIGLAGGPGQAAIPLVGDIHESVAAGMGTHDLLVFDQRGTGESGLLRCPSVETVVFGAASVADCARRLGRRRAFYSTQDSAKDIEGIRAALSIPKVVLYGTSYGSKLSLVYAQAYPQRVESLVLDSVVPVNGPDPWLRPNFRAEPQALNNLCSLAGPQAPALPGNTGSACGDFWGAPADYLSQLLSKLRHKPIKGEFFTPDGDVQRLRLRSKDIFYLMIAGNSSASIRAATPGLLYSGAHGDPAPLLRFIQGAVYPDGPNGSSSSPREFSSAVYVATTCEDGPVPWRNHSSASTRARVLRATTSELDKNSFAPYDPSTSLAAGMLSVCTRWPETPRSTSTQPLPDVPALILAGSDDTNTPPTDAQMVAAQLPRSELVIVGATGHSVVASDESGCAQSMVDEFLGNSSLPTNDCVVAGFEPEQLAAVPPDPQNISDFEAPAGVPGAAGRVEIAAQHTLQDLKRQAWGEGLIDNGGDIVLTNPVEHYAGLRGGTAEAKDPRRERHNALRIKLTEFSYVDGVRLNGNLRLDDNTGQFVGLVRISSAHVRGHLRFSRDSVRGRLNGAAFTDELLPALTANAGDEASAAVVADKQQKNFSMFSAVARLPGR